MRILHTGDIHLGDLAGPTKDGENLRRLDTIGCMKAIVRMRRASSRRFRSSLATCSTAPASGLTPLWTT